LPGQADNLQQAVKMSKFTKLMLRKLRPLARVCCLLVPLAGCSQPVSPHPNPPDAAARQSTTNLPYGQPVRVIVKFSQAVPYRSDVFLQDMQERIKARVSYLSSVSRDTHVYQLEPQAGHSAAETLQRLGTLPFVLRVETDARVKVQ
jgi:hypothetical protein